MKPLSFVLCMSLALLGCEYVETELPEANADVQHEEGYCDELKGSWKMVSMQVTTADTSYTQDESETPTLKVLNNTHWMFIRQSADQFVFAQGGRYRLEDGVYTEIVEYSAEPGNVGSEYVFECRLEGDSLWYHKGDLGSLFVDELWRRVGRTLPNPAQ